MFILSETMNGVIIRTVVVTILCTCYHHICKASPVITYEEANPGCVYNNITYRAHTKFQPDPCTTCHCPNHGGQVRCAIEDCRWEPNCLNVVKGEHECCGVCKEYGCRHSDNKVYQFGAVIPGNPCEHCYCPKNSIATVCVMVKCPPVKCVDAVHEKDRCCPTCPNGPTCRAPNEQVIKDGDTVQIDPCTKCSCDRSSWFAQEDGRASCRLEPCIIKPCAVGKRRKFIRGKCCPLCL